MPITQDRMVQLLTDAEDILNRSIMWKADLRAMIELQATVQAPMGEFLTSLALALEKMDIQPTRAMLIERYHFDRHYDRNKSEAARLERARRDAGVLPKMPRKLRRKLAFTPGIANRNIAVVQEAAQTHFPEEEIDPLKQMGSDEVFGEPTKSNAELAQEQAEKAAHAAAFEAKFGKLFETK